LRFLGARPQGGELTFPLLERLAGRLEIRERPLVRRDAVAIELREHADGARRLSDAPQIRGGEEHAQVARLAQLVQLDDARAQLGTRRLLGLLQRRHARGCRPEVGGDLRRVGVDLLQLLRLQLALDLELPQVAKDGALLRREAVGFALQRLQPLARTRGQRRGPRAVGLLRQERRRTHHDAPRAEHFKKAACHRYPKVSARRNTSARSARCP
jgi:hypothetical protein